MSWYYAENNERRGPFDEAAFEELVANGVVKPETSVWRDGQADWMPYGKVSAGTTQIGTGSEMGVCSESGKSFPRNELVEIDGHLVSAEYKNVVLQRLREGVGSGERVYAGFWIRFGAKFVDGFILNVAGAILGFVIGMGLTGDKQAATIINMVVTLLLNAGYMIYFTGKFGATPGKMACKLEVIRADGSPMTYGRATGRYFAELLSAFTLGIGYLMVISDAEKRALHDRICDTRVVRKQ